MPTYVRGKMSELKFKIVKKLVNGKLKEVKVYETPEQDEFFQSYCNDENLGRNPLVRQPMRFSQAIGEDKTIYESIKNELGNAYKVLEEIANVENKQEIQSINDEESEDSN